MVKLLRPRMTKEGENYSVIIPGYKNIRLVSDLGKEIATVKFHDVFDYSKKGSDSKNRNELKKTVKWQILTIQIPKDEEARIDLTPECKSIFTDPKNKKHWEWNGKKVKTWMKHGKTISITTFRKK